MPEPVFAAFQNSASTVYSVGVAVAVMVAPDDAPVMTSDPLKVPVLARMFRYEFAAVAVSYMKPSSSPSAPLVACVTFSPLRKVPVELLLTGTLIVTGPVASHHAETLSSPAGYASAEGSAFPPQRSAVATEVVSLLVPSPEAMYTHPAFFRARVTFQTNENALFAEATATLG